MIQRQTFGAGWCPSARPSNRLGLLDPANWALRLALAADRLALAIQTTILSSGTDHKNPIVLAARGSVQSGFNEVASWRPCFPAARPHRTLQIPFDCERGFRRIVNTGSGAHERVLECDGGAPLLTVFNQG